MEAEPCSPAVGYVKNNDPELLTCLNPEEPPELLNNAWNLD